jgi:hypothetical protein
MMKPRFLTLVGMIAMAAVARILPHPWNVTPVAAMALFGGVQFRDRVTAFGVPLVAMLIGDAFVGFHPLMPLVYACFALTVVLGFWVKQNFSWQRVVMGSMVASVLFFVATNFGMWAVSTMYPKTAQGLVMCYIAALPYFRNTLFGDLGYTALLFGGFYLAGRAFPVLSDARAS